MADERSSQQAENSVNSGENDRLDNAINKEISKLQYYLEGSDELLRANDAEEIKTTVKQASKITNKLSELILQLEEIKIDSGVSPRTVRQWKKDTKAKYARLLQEKEKLSDFLEANERKKQEESERRQWQAKQQQEIAMLEERHLRERRLWEEKLQAELRATEKRMELEKETPIATASTKLPKLKITPFKGTVVDWIRFENIFLTQIDKQPISDEQKFGYLLELVIPKVRDRLANLKPSTEGYETAWKRLKSEYGQTKQVINAHVEEIIGLPAVKGTNYAKIHEFYEKLSKSFDALQSLGEDGLLKAITMTVLNKLPSVKPDLVRIDDKWEDWGMNDLLDNLQKWLVRNKTLGESKKTEESPRRDHAWYAGRGKGSKPRSPTCIFCKGEHWSNDCKEIKELEARRKFFMENKLCYNCGQAGHRASNCHGGSCYRCKGKHHTSLCEGKNEAILTGYTSAGATLPAIIPVNIQGVTLWAYLDTGSGRNFISQDALMKLKLSPSYHETRHIVTVNGTKKQSLPVFKTEMVSLDGKAKERIEVTGVTKMPNFTTIKRPDMNQLKQQFDHTRDKKFYMQRNHEYPIHLIIGDNTFCRIKTHEMCKGKPGEPLVEGTTFGWIIHGGDLPNDECMFCRDVSDYQKLYSLDVLGVEDRGEDDEWDVYTEFNEAISRNEEGRYQVGIPWIPGARLTDTNEMQSRRRLKSVNKKINHDPGLKAEYQKIISDQLDKGIIEKVPDEPDGSHVFYMPHKPVVKSAATTTKVRMVFDASAKPNPLARSINECMYKGPSLQPLLWDILIRARMTPNLLLGDIKQAFLQVGLKPEDRDAFRFLFELLDGTEEKFRFTRIPFGAEASPFLLGATLQYHYNNQAEGSHSDTLLTLKENTYVDNLMKTGDSVQELEEFKHEAKAILDEAKFPVHKWESNVQSLESDDMPNPGKILGLTWHKHDDELEIQIPQRDTTKPTTKKSILSHLAGIYDPLGIVSPTVVEGKHIYREACDENRKWDSEVSSGLAKDWLKWTRQLRNIRIPRSVIQGCKKVEAIHLHLFADASNMACSAVSVAVIEHDTGKVKGLLTSKSRISKRNTSIARLELVSGQMAANLARNLANALKRLPVKAITVWMDSLVALYWISSPGRAWKVFVANRVKKIAELTEEIGIRWKYVPSEKNVADVGSRGATLNQMENKEWYTGPEWLLNEQDWPPQPELLRTTSVTDEEKPVKEVVGFTNEEPPDEWELLLKRRPYWNTLRVTSWALRFVRNSRSKKAGVEKIKGPLTTEEIMRARNVWIRKVQQQIPEDRESSGWRLEKDDEIKILRCVGRIRGYSPIYLEQGLLVGKLIRHVHEQMLHLGTASTMGAIRETWWIPRLRSLVKKTINECHTCKAFSTKPYGKPNTSPLPQFRTEESKPFETTGVDFAGPLARRDDKNKEAKASILIFTCSVTRAVHLEVTKTQTAEEFQVKLNAFITRKTRPRRIVSDNASVFKTTAQWIKRIRKNEELQNFLAQQEIIWQFNLSKSPWWGGMYERIIKELKKTLYKTLGRTHLTFEQLCVVVMDIERHLNNRPLTYVESEGGEPRVLTPNSIIWGEDAHIFEECDQEESGVSKVKRRLEVARQHAWSRWKREYVHSLMESHRVVKGDGKLPEVGEIVLVVGEEKNRGFWKKGKVLRHIVGKDGVMRGVVLLHKNHKIERPIQLVCPLEIRSHGEVEKSTDLIPQTEDARVKHPRAAAELAKQRIKSCLAEDD